MSKWVEAMTPAIESEHMFSVQYQTEGICMKEVLAWLHMGMP